MNLSLRHKQLWFALILAVVDTLFFSLTNPSSVASILLMVGFILLVLSLFVVVNGFVALLGLYGIKLERQKKRLSITITSVIGAILALQSIGELSIKDMMVVLPLSTVAYLYVIYIRRRSIVSDHSVAPT